MASGVTSSAFGTGKLPEGRSGKLCALGVAFLGLVLCWLLLSTLIGFLSDLKSSVEDKKILLARTESLVASIPRLQERAEEAARNADGNSVLIEEDSDATAQARLQEIVQGVGQAAEVELSSQEPLPLVRHGAFQRLALRVSFTSSWPLFVKFLNGVSENASPRLLIDDLQIQSAGSTRLVDEASKGRLVDVSLTIVALRNAALPSSRQPLQP
ncbi:type II secretion system protein GspM [Acetobacter conturbans]|nr:type II secretion system protein GspM [Acetobacter conturbans]